MNGQEPAITRTDPRAYYLYLQTQGMNPTQAIQAVEQRFGPPKSANERAREQAGNAQTNALYQTGGVIAGAIGSRLIYDKVAGWIDPATGEKATKEVVNNLTQTVPVSTTTPSTTTSSATGSTGSTGLEAFNKNFTPVNPGSLPAGQQVPEGMTAIRSNIDGTVQMVPTESLSDGNFLSDIDWGKAGQAGMGVLQLYQAYNMAKNKEYAGAGIYGVGGAANIAASGYAGAAAQTAAGDALGGYLVPGANLLMGAYGAYKTAEMTGNMAAGKQRNVGAATSGAMAGAAIGSVIPVIGTGIGAAIGAAAGYLGSAAFGSKKGKAQFMRDGIRGVLQENGILDESFQGTLADGTKYDFGKDGSTLKWKNIDKIAEKQPAAWNAAVPLTDALAAAYGFVGQKASDISAWYAKGAVSNAGDDASIAVKNAQHFAQQQGLTFDMIKARLDEAMKDERINQSQYDYYLNGARQLTAGIKPQKGPAQGPQGAPPPQAPPAQQPPPQQGNMSIRQLLQQNMQKQ